MALKKSFPTHSCCSSDDVMMMMGEMNGEKMPRLPVGSSQIQNGFAETTKFGTLKRFARVVSNQIIG